MPTFFLLWTRIYRPTPFSLTRRQVPLGITTWDISKVFIIHCSFLSNPFQVFVFHFPCQAPGPLGISAHLIGIVESFLLRSFISMKTGMVVSTQRNLLTIYRFHLSGIKVFASLRVSQVSYLSYVVHFHLFQCPAHDTSFVQY